MDYYEVLGIKKGASPEDIKKAYRRLSKENHPDRHKGDKTIEEKYKQINRAYEVLSDPKKKQMYDQFGSEDGPFGGVHAEHGRSTQGAPFGAQGFEGFGDIFETFFGGGGAGGRRQADTRGRDVEVRIEISLLESFQGTKKTLRVRKMVVCETCKGTGDKEGSKKISCPECRGTGQVTRTAQSFFGMIQQSMMCEKCKGSGKIPETPCAKCKGEGRVQGEEEITVDIPRGIAHGQTLRVRGKGEAGRQGTAAGDLFVNVGVRPDPRFDRDDADLHVTTPLSILDAVLGATIAIETLDGKVDLKIPEGTQPEQIFRIKGHGMPVLSSSRFGDLYVHVRLDVPKKLSRAERKMWEELRKGEE